MDGRVHPCERARNVVQGNQPKMLRGLRQKGTVARDRDGPLPWHGHAMLPAHRAHLTRPCQPWGTWYARIAPSARKGGKSSGQPIAMRVWGGGKKRTPSCHGADTGCASGLGNITRRARGQTSLRCLGTRNTEESVEKVVHRSVALSTGAPFPARASTAIEYRTASRLYDC